MTESEIRSAFLTLNLPIDTEQLKKIIDDIALNKQLTQKDLRYLKMHCSDVSALYKVLHTFIIQTPDLIIVSDEDSFSFD